MEERLNVLYVVEKGDKNMAHQKTSKRVGSIASKLLRSPSASSKAKSAAGSALVNRPHPRKTTTKRK